MVIIFLRTRARGNHPERVIGLQEPAWAFAHSALWTVFSAW
jgi:hypothetical protein